MIDPLDDQIREALARVVQTAPTPRPYDDLGTQVEQRAATNKHRWVAVAAGVVALAGVAGVALAIQARDGGSSPATIPSVPSSHSDVTTAPSTTASTAPVSAPTTGRPPLPDPAGFSAGAFPDVPDGSLDAGAGDLIGVTADGTISLYADVLAAEPPAPVALAGHPAPGRFLYPLDAVALNGSLISDLPIELDSGLAQVTTISRPQSAPVPLVSGRLGAVSHDGTRFVVREREGVRNELAVYDALRGTVARRGMAAFPPYQAGDPAFVWSEDDRELYSFTPHNGERQAEFTRIDSATLDVIDSTVIEDWGLDGRLGASKHVFFVGMWDGQALFIADDGAISAYAVPEMSPVEIEVPHWLSVFTPTGAVTSYDIAADGTTAVWIDTGTTYVQRSGEAPVAVRDDLVQAAFVDAVNTAPSKPATTRPSPLRR